jgi:ethanolaminephosphotransferase
MYYVIWTVLFNFHVSHWEKYNTGVLYLPWGYDFGMWGSTIMYLATWYYGFTLWKNPLFGMSPGIILEFVLHISAMSNLPMVFINLYNSYKNKTGKMRTPFECIRPLIPLILFMTISLIWAHNSPNDIMNKDPRAVFLLTGTIFSNISVSLLTSFFFFNKNGKFNDFLLNLILVSTNRCPNVEY